MTMTLIEVDEATLVEADVPCGASIRIRRGAHIGPWIPCPKVAEFDVIVTCCEGLERVKHRCKDHMRPDRRILCQPHDSAHETITLAAYPRRTK